MDEKQLYLALSNILQSIKKEIVNWRIEGSTNLFIQGIPIKPLDLDIATDKTGLFKFEKALQRYSPKKVFSEKVKCETLKCTIAGIQVEIICYESDDRRAMFDKARPITWSRLELPCLPLEYAKQFYENIQLPDKVEIIEKYLASK